MLSCVCDSILLCSVFESSLFSLGCCKSVLLSATGAADVLWPKYLGTFEATGEEYEGKTVYKNNDGRYLYRHSDGTWRTGYGIGASGIIKSVVETAECPVSINQWQYSDVGWHCWHHGRVLVSYRMWFYTGMGNEIPRLRSTYSNPRCVQLYSSSDCHNRYKLLLK